MHHFAGLTTTAIKEEAYKVTDHNVPECAEGKGLNVGGLVNPFVFAKTSKQISIIA